MTTVELAFLVIYFAVLCVLAVYGSHRYRMAFLYYRHKFKLPTPSGVLKTLPKVTIQLPIYNELYVVERLIDSVCHIDYPRELLQIQVLDDSTDETSSIARACVERNRQQGHRVAYLHRESREGFKAGALAYGLRFADGELIAVFDAKYIYNFWRPITAIRLEHVAGGINATADPTWTPFVTTPMHPEYPCAHCVVAGALGAVIREELHGRPVPHLSSTSPTAPGVVHGWDSIDSFVDEVRMARIYDGVHYRNSTEVGARVGTSVGVLVQQRFAPATDH